MKNNELLIHCKSVQFCDFQGWAAAGAGSSERPRCGLGLGWQPRPPGVPESDSLSSSRASAARPARAAAINSPSLLRAGSQEEAEVAWIVAWKEHSIVDALVTFFT